jgi:hypothetical protein
MTPKLTPEEAERLIEGVRECKKEAGESSIDFHEYWNVYYVIAYQAGHKAACDRLIPALKEALRHRDYWRPYLAKGTEEKLDDKIRALLEATNG